MSEILFPNFEPIDGTTALGDFENVKPFHMSSHGHSRLFTAIYKGKKVIIKALKVDCLNDLQCREDLKKEYEITSQLDHKFIRKALGFENIQGLGDCIIFEFIDGKSFAEHVRVGTLSDKEIKSILVDLCDALNYMHQRGIIHCDLKPENIVITSSDLRPKIIDIGLPETEYKTDRELLIKENEFIAPELIKGEEADQRSDVYSLGKIIEFVIERNMLKQYRNVATHCTQFSREQRFDSISDVRSVINKGYSVVKLLLIFLALVAIGVAAYIYVPKIIERSKAEKEERLTVDFNHEVEKINAETQSLCEKYHVKSLDGPLGMPEEWKTDSIQLSKRLAPFFEVVENLRPEAEQVIQNQKQAIMKSRQHDIDSLKKLQAQTIDSIAVPAN